MQLKRLAVRISAEAERDIQEVVEREQLTKATAVRTLLQMGIAEWQRKTALDSLRDGKVTFAKAAEIAKLSLWEFADLVKQRNVEWIRFPPEEIENVLTALSTSKHE